MIKFSGECKQCGYCCKYIIAPFLTSESTHEWLTARGWKLIIPGDQWSCYRLKHRCPNLNGDNSCVINDHKPVVCKSYPHHLPDARFLGKCKGYKCA